MEVFIIVNLLQSVTLLIFCWLIWSLMLDMRRAEKDIRSISRELGEVQEELGEYEG